MQDSGAAPKTSPPHNEATSRLLWVLAFLAFFLTLISLAAISVQGRQSQELEVVAQWQKESNNAQITQLERELWHFDSAMTRTDSAPLDLTTEQGLRFNALATRVTQVFDNKNLARLHERNEYKLLVPRIQDWVFRAKPLVDRQDWATSEWVGLMKELVPWLQPGLGSHLWC